MTVFIKIIAESVLQALQQLQGNKLRSFLSLLGVSIGIFCIIGVQSAVDSLEDNVRGSIEKLGSDVVYMSKFSWAEDPGQNWMKIMRRPNINYQDFEAVKERSKLAGLISYHVEIGTRTAKFRSNSAEGAYAIGVTHDFGEMFNFNYADGRYFSQAEYNFGSNKAILGYEVAQKLFGSNIDPIGKSFKMNGRSLEVIGVLKKEGESLVNILNFDDSIIISYELARKIANLKPNHPFGNSSVNIKAAPGADVEELKDELTGILRAHRRLQPREESDFALNTISIISNFLNSFFGVLNMLGLVVGGFAIFVGMFSVSNIMFVSVKERTNIIGIKKALGAKQFMILMEFLIEAIILCLLGGVVGLLLVFAVTGILSQLINFDLYMSFNNIMVGVVFSMVVGVVSGFIPALQAARMDPVEAMRQK